MYIYTFVITDTVKPFIIVMMIKSPQYPPSPTADQENNGQLKQEFPNL